jgi:hypothetical protein
VIKFSKVIAILVFALFFVVGQVSANPINFSFFGNYRFLDKNSDNFAETIEFLNIIQPGSGSGAVTAHNPNPDPLFADPGFEYIELPDLILDSTSFVSGSRYDFSPSVCFRRACVNKKNMGPGAEPPSA